MAIPLLAVGMVASAGASLYQGSQLARAERRRARIAEADAKEAKRLGALDAERIAEDQRRAIGEAVVSAGASGFGVEGSALDAVEAIARLYAVEGADARYGAARRSQALQRRAQEGRAQASASLLTGAFNAAGIILSGTGSIAASRSPVAPSLLE